MMHHEFEKYFKPMTQALALKVTPVQANYFWEEFHGVDARDWAQACHELAMGNPGYLPKLTVFRDTVAKARESRAQADEVERDKAARRLLYVSPGEPHRRSSGAQLFGRCCAKLVMDVSLGQPGQKRDEALAFIQAAMQDDGLVADCDTWRTPDGEHPLLWLNDQVNRRIEA